MQGPTWGGVRARSGHRVVQRRQLALHAAEALGEAGLLPLQHLLQLADGREELLFVETVLGREGVSTATAVAALSSRQPPRPLGPRWPPQPHQAPRHPGLSQVTGTTLPPSPQITAPARLPTKTKLLLFRVKGRTHDSEPLGDSAVHSTQSDLSSVCSFKRLPHSPLGICALRSGLGDFILSFSLGHC